MRILGISAFYHDSAAALIEDGHIVAAAQDFYLARKREVTLAYVLLAGRNDTKVCAEALAGIAGQLRCNVNVIPYNPVADVAYARPSKAAVEAFCQRLRRRGVNVQVRRSRGLDAAAACGQLRRRAPDAPTQGSED